MFCAIRVRLAIAFVAVLFVACGGGDDGPVNGPPPLGPPPAPATGTLGDGRLTEIVEWARATENAPALGVIIIRHGQVVERAVSGVRSIDNNVRVTVDDEWHVSSLTKSMTATLAAMLVEDGLITWDTTPLDVWPELDATIHSDFRNITLRQLLSHTAGLKRDDPWDGADDGAPGTTVEKRRAWTARLLAESPLVPPGNWAYSNLGYMVAGAMIETRAQTPWETLLTTRIFTPLGMIHSGFGAPGTAGQLDQPLGHNSFSDHFNAIQPGPGSDSARTMGPAGTVHATMNDFARYLQAHMSGEQGTPGILTTASFHTLHTVVSQDYALGWLQVAPLEGLGATAFGHNGTNLKWFALTWFVPDRDVGLFIVTNCGGDRGLEVLSKLDMKLRERIAATP